MPQVSKQAVSKKFQKKLDDLFFESFASLSPKNTQGFIDDLFTPTEKIMIAKRICIAHFLLEGYDYRSISHILKVSSSTIKTIKKTLVRNSSGYKKIISSINKRHNTFKFLDKTFSDIFIRKYPSKSMKRS